MLKNKLYNITSLFIVISLLFGFTNQVFAKTDEELISTNQIEFFIDQDDFSCWVNYPKDGKINNKYWYEIIDGVQRSGVRIEKISEVRYQVIAETQEQKDLLIGYETVTLGAESWQKLKLQTFLQSVECPMADERIRTETEQAQQKENSKINYIETINNRIRQKDFNKIGSFDDVNSSDWYYNAISECESLGLISGYGNGNFGPNDPITMWQACLITLRCVNLMNYGIPEINGRTYIHTEPGEGSFEDDYSVILNRCKDFELIPGGSFRGDKVEDPRFGVNASYNDNAYREEAISCYYRAFNKYFYSWTNYVLQYKLNLQPIEEKNSINIPDFNGIDDTYKEFVSNAYKFGLALGYDSSGRFNPKGEITRAEFCQIIYNSNFPKAIKVILSENLIDYTDKTP